MLEEDIRAKNEGLLLHEEKLGVLNKFIEDLTKILDAKTDAKLEPSKAKTQGATSMHT